MNHPDHSQLTDRQLEVLATIYRLTAAGNPPTYRDLMLALSVTSPNAVAGFIDALEKKGWLTVQGDGAGYRRSRAIRLRGMVMRPSFTCDAHGERLRAAVEAATVETLVEEVG